MKRYFGYAVIFALGCALSQLTRTVDLPQAVGYAVIVFAAVIGAALSLGAMCLGGMTLYHFLMDGAESIWDQLQTSRRPS
jgi:hypothetical protein